MTNVRVERFDESRGDDFLAVHSEQNGAGWCRCVAWWVPTWDGWGERSAAENLELRTALCARGEYDGYLAYDGDLAVGWCQAGPRDRLGKLVAQFGLEPDPSAWAVTCFSVAPSHRRRGVARALLDAVVADAPRRGARRLEAFPRRGSDEDGDVWNGPESLFLGSGFVVVHEDPVRPVLARPL